MQLRMLTRRSLNGSMTVVGDIAQSTGAWAHADWDEVLEQLPDRRPARRAELTIGYRLPGPNMALATKVLALAAPDLTPPSSVRQEGEEPRFVEAPAGRHRGGRRSSRRSSSARAVDPGSVAVIVPDSLRRRGRRRLRGAGHRVRPGRPQRPRQPDHPRAGQPGEGPRARRLGRGRAGRHRRGGGAGRAVALRRPHPRHQAPRARPRAPAARGARG